MGGIMIGSSNKDIGNPKDSYEDLLINGALAALLPSWAVDATPMAVTTTRARTATIGAVPREMATSRGATASIRGMVSCTATAASLRRTRFRCAASRTSRFPCGSGEVA